VTERYGRMPLDAALLRLQDLVDDITCSAAQYAGENTGEEQGLRALARELSLIVHSYDDETMLTQQGQGVASGEWAVGSGVDLSLLPTPYSPFPTALEPLLDLDGPSGFEEPPAPTPEELADAEANPFRGPF
jgi:hypothetical protein